MKIPRSLMRSAGRVVRDAALDQRGKSRVRKCTPTSRTSEHPAWDCPGDFAGKPPVTYAPHPGEMADPGEIVWGWVPYEEDHTQGKDRPLLVVGRDRDWLLCVRATPASGRHPCVPASRSRCSGSGSDRGGRDASGGHPGRLSDRRPCLGSSRSGNCVTPAPGCHPCPPAAARRGDASATTDRATHRREVCLGRVRGLIGVR